MFWMLGLWTLGHWTTVHLDSGRLESWTLDNWTLRLWTAGHLDSGILNTWTLDGWTLGLWNLGARRFFPFLVTSISILLLVNVEFLIILGTLRLMYYCSVERAANDCYNSNMLQFILQFKFPGDTSNCSWTQLFMKRRANNWLWNDSNR